MDYMFLSSLRGTQYQRLIVSYDIACQWSIHLCERILAFPEDLQLVFSENGVIFVVPKFHLPSHVASCQTAYSYNLTRGAADTDGEAPERGWSDINPASNQTKEMGPGSRRDVIDNLFGDWNHKKLIGLGEFYICSYCNTLYSYFAHS